MEIKRGNIFKIKLTDNPLGSEQGGTRYCVILSNNVGNHYSPVVTVALITSKDKDRKKQKPQPTHYKFILYEPSMVMAEQLITIDKQRLIKQCGKLNEEQMKEVDKCLAIAIGLDINYK